MKRASWQFVSLVVLGSTGLVPRAEGQAPKAQAARFFGDFRLRYENTSNQDLPPLPSPDVNRARNRAVIRFRAGVTIPINQLLTFGGRLATGPSDDPNSADATLGAFVDDIAISLDRVYLALTHRDVFLTGGKFANPFLTTDLVWDGDVNPQGIAGSYAFAKSRSVVPQLTGIYSIIDEQSLASDSYMAGGQAQAAIRVASNWTVTLAGAYYDYSITSLINADAGDTRSNQLNADGTRYLSDFDLLDLIATVRYGGFGERYPVLFVGDFVKNLGAVGTEDTGFMVDVFVGRSSQEGDRRFHYGYAEAETDAVLAAFSNDNTTIATNYRQHTLSIDFVPLRQTFLNVTWYLFRKRNVSDTMFGNAFISRLRLNAVVRF